MTNKTPHQTLNEISQRNRQIHQSAFEFQTKLEEEGMYQDFFNEIRVEADKEKRKDILLKYAQKIDAEELGKQSIQDLFN